MANKTETMRWIGEEHGHLVLIDQTLLPLALQEIECKDVETVWEAIKMLRVRGAPGGGTFYPVSGAIELSATTITGGVSSRTQSKCAESAATKSV